MTPPNADALAGAYLGDFVRGRVDDLVDLPVLTRQGITLHRKVDAFTDAHPIWRESADRLPSGLRRLAGIVIDIVYDHYLCRHWDRYSETPLPEFAQLCYGSLLSRTQFMEEDARRGVRRMQEQDWIQTYLEPEGIDLAFRRLSRRSRALVELPKATESFRNSYDELEQDFLAYYPKLIQFAEETWEDVKLTPPGL